MQIEQKDLNPINSKLSYLGDENNMSQNVKGNENMQNKQQQQQSSSQWSQIIGQVMEKLTGANMSTTISLNDTLKSMFQRHKGLAVEIWVVPSETLTGKIVWATEGHKTAGGGG